MRRLPPDRHVECLAGDWVDLVPQRELHHLLPHDDATPSPSGRRFTTVVASPPAPPSPPASSPDAWLALAEESMRPPRADAPARRARSAARLVRACATALESRDAPGARTSAEGKDAFRVPPALLGGNARGNARAPNDAKLASFADASAERRQEKGSRKARGMKSFFRLAFIVIAAATCLALTRTLSVEEVFFFHSRQAEDVVVRSASFPGTTPRGNRRSRLTFFTTNCDDEEDEEVSSRKETILYLRSSLESSEELTASLKKNVTALRASLETFQRQSDFWYDAFNDATDMNAYKALHVKRSRFGKRLF